MSLVTDGAAPLRTGRADAALTCPACLEGYEQTTLVRTKMVCPDCGYHLRVSARERLSILVDAGSFVEWDSDIASTDPLAFVDKLPYVARLSDAQTRTGERDALIVGAASLRGRPIAIGVFEFGFMGGSMGSVVGEKTSRLFIRAQTENRPVIMVTASGGARMQEGALALLQMAKVTIAIGEFRNSRLPYLVLLADPTTGGVAASVAMLGDLVFAEPGAQIGFAGPRVIEQTIRAPLPRGFQRAERLLERGLIDAVVPRSEQRERISALIGAFMAARSGQ